MNYIDLYHEVSHEASKLVTRRYSTSFSRSITLLDPVIRRHVYNIYGFVRVADEIVDTFTTFDRRELLDDFVEDYRQALDSGISTNPILHAFCRTQRQYDIPQNLIDDFLESMYMDLGDVSTFQPESYKKYIYGSAEVVGLMCLVLFVAGDPKKYEALKPAAQHMGAALQKVNFLRDMEADYHLLGRTYFPKVDFGNFTEADKRDIEEDIAKDFSVALEGIKKLPLTSRYAVLLAYRYYHGLYHKICALSPDKLLQGRVRVNNFAKMVLFSKLYTRKTFRI
ncbi:phytoene/squalene synthase family protein [Pareuzebyella sediminis]|uniref:phytoene/squalene synthase family protein n=1 Tax=Pareuzebyella sediminis TaxID=2607998 RepID=UPI0011EFF985|nr:phytoene/squalene synthase family protein [Pareuzebyella sediminis]